MNDLSGRPSTTRLRFISASDPNLVVAFLEALGVRIQIYGAPIFAKGKWYLWFVPGDQGADIPSKDLG